MADLFKIMRVLCAILGLIFSLTSRYHIYMIIGCFVAAVVLELITLLLILTGKGQVFSNTLMAIIEGVIGCLLLIFTIWLLAEGGAQDALLILAIVMGFVLPALYFISVYERL